MSASLLPLFVAVPLAAAALLVLVRRAPLERALLLAVPLGCAAGGVALLAAHRDTPVLAHGVGGYAPGIAIPFASDALSATMLVVTGVVTAASGWFLIATGEDRFRLLPPLVLMLTAGVNGALLTADLFNLFVFVEVMLLPSYALIALTGSWRRLGIGRMFVLVNLVTSTILLMGVGLVYGVTGTANLASLAGRAADDPRAGSAVAIVVLALAIKAGVVPVHGWLPRAYPATSAGIMTLFSALHTKVALYALLRVAVVAYGAHALPWVGVLAAVVVATMLVGAVCTIGERRIRAALAFQMVSGVGHILIGLVLLTPAAIAAALFYLAHHVVTMAALLTTAGAIEDAYGTGRYDRLNGLARRDPVPAAVTVLGLFSLVGLPPTSGLWGKVGLLGALAEETARAPVLAWVLIGATVLASLASLLALQRLWVDVFWGKPLETYRPDDLATGRGEPVPLPASHRIRPRLAAPGVALIAVSVLMFVAAGPLLDVAGRAAGSLLDVGTYAAAVLR